MTESRSCVFCRILDGHEKASFVAQGSDAVAFLDIHPINEGHTLVIPRKHAALIGEVEEVSAIAMWSLARRVARGLRTSGLRCEGINFFLSDGATAGEQVFHSHLNVVPRWEGDGFELKFPPHYGAAAPRDKLDDVAARLRKRLSAS